MGRLISLVEWNNRQPLPRCMEQVRRWVREGKLYPAPYLDGRQYMIDEHAVRIDPNRPNTPQFHQEQGNLTSLSLLQRIKNGTSEGR